MSDRELYTVAGAELSRRIGVVRSTVSNWLKRGVLPEHLQPERFGITQDPYWTEEQAAAFPQWMAERNPRGRGRKPGQAQTQVPPNVREWEQAVAFAYANADTHPLTVMLRLIGAGDKLAYKN